MEPAVREQTMMRRLAFAVVVVLALSVSSIAFAASGLAGKYTTTITSPPQLKGKWALTLTRSRTYTVALNRRVMARGRYSATATTITFSRETGGSGCSGSGTYAWRKTGRILRFTRKREAASCRARAAVLAHPFTQVR